MKVHEIINTTIEAMAEKIDRLKGELFCKDYEIEKLKIENKKLEAELRDLLDALKAEEVDGGLL